MYIHMAPEKEKITTMILYVDLKCPCCYKKVRKLLCKLPQIRDQVFDVDKNKVTITVVCCDPERFRDKLCCKGGRAIQSIEIVEKEPPPKPQPRPKLPKAPRPPPSDVPKPPVSYPMPPPVLHPPPRLTPPRPRSLSRPLPQPQQQPQPMAIDGYYPHLPFCPPVYVCCQECYEGWDGGPFHYGYGRPVPPPPCYDYYGYQYPPNRPCYVSRCDYFSEDNPQGCSIM